MEQNCAIRVNQSGGSKFGYFKQQMPKTLTGCKFMTGKSNIGIYSKFQKSNEILPVVWNLLLAAAYEQFIIGYNQKVSHFLLTFATKRFFSVTLFFRGCKSISLAKPN